MLSYVAADCHCIGKSHILKGMKCEDFSDSYSDENVSAAVISDGHGDKNCFRSALGAKFACETALSLCRKFCSDHTEIKNVNEVDFESKIKHLERNIAEQWKKKVSDYTAENPFSDEELKKLEADVREYYLTGNFIEKAYGCTLISAVITENIWFALQIGDGVCTAAYEDGAFVKPVPADENCCGNFSSSICNKNSAELFRHYYSNIKPLAVFVCSDGIEESFDESGLYNCFYSIAYWVKHNGSEKAEKDMAELLPRISEGGSSDDVSVSVIVNTECEITKPRQSWESVVQKVNVCKNQYEHLGKLYKENIEQRRKLNEQKIQLEDEIEILTEQLEEVTGNFTIVSKDLEELDIKAEELFRKYETAEEQSEKAEAFKINAEKYWKPKLEAIGLWQENIIKTDNVQDFADEKGIR